jgi:hypothetical protein
MFAFEQTSRELVAMSACGTKRTIRPHPKFCSMRAGMTLTASADSRGAFGMACPTWVGTALRWQSGQVVVANDRCPAWTSDTKALGGQIVR